MKRTHLFMLCMMMAGLLLVTAVSLADEAPAQGTSGEQHQPRVFFVDLEHMQQVKQRIAQGDNSYAPALNRLRQQADKALQAGPFSVTYKTRLPVSGDKHDYYSMGSYWWPDSDKPDGLPYIRRDGYVNPEIEEIPDLKQWQALARETHYLAVAYFFFEDEKYAEHAARLFRAWFLDTETRMNPHLEYAQAIPGRVNGRDIGIVDLNKFNVVVDSIGLIEPSQAWTEEDQQGVLAWCAEYMKWLWESKNGKSERRRVNNHGTSYDVQALGVAFFLGREDIAKEILQNVVAKRIAEVKPNGEQPHETARTRGWAYSTINLRALVTLARAAEQNLGMDIWNEKAENGASIRQAFVYMRPYVGTLKNWPHGKLHQKDTVEFEKLMHSVSDVYTDAAFEKSIKALPELHPGSLQVLTGVYLGNEF